MTDEQFSELRTLILNLAVRVEAVELHLKKMDRDNAETRQASRQLLMAIEAVGNDKDASLDVIGLPPDFHQN